MEFLIQRDFQMFPFVYTENDDGGSPSTSIERYNVIFYGIHIINIEKRFSKE